MVEVAAPPGPTPWLAVVEVSAPVVDVADPVEVGLTPVVELDGPVAVGAPTVVVVALDGGGVVRVTVVVGTGVVAT